MKPQQKTSKNGILPSILLLALGAMHASAVPLQVDLGRTGQASLQSGWTEWNTDVAGVMNVQNTFAYAEGTAGTVNSGNGGSTKCWGTNIGTPGYYADPTTDSRLVSPVIDLTSIAGAELSFAHAIDLPATDQAVVRILNANTDEEIVAGVFPLTITDADINSALWTTRGPHTLPVGTPIRIVWSLTGTGGPSKDYLGWYIDDVNVVETTP